MFIGIDVGGTYTDAVLTDGRHVIAKCKTPTVHNNLMTSLLNALDNVTSGQDLNKINRVVLSTTLITNIIAEQKFPPVALVLLPGPGLSYREYRFNTLTQFLSGAVDYRGREIVAPNESEIAQAAAKIVEAGYEHVAVVGKFSNRNNVHECLVKEIFEKMFTGITVETGHTVSGQLNFPRRIATTMLTAATKQIFSDFCSDVMQSLKERKITAPAFILKADGGTLPLSIALNRPVETIFSGPAASTLGAMSLSPKGQTSVVVDIGGTTTDLSLILSGDPLLSSKGAEVESFLTHIRSFAVKSVPLGGDSTVVADKGQIVILPERNGPAYCLGGPEPTLSDALRYMDKIQLGDPVRAREAMNKLAGKTGKSPDETAQAVISAAHNTIVNSIEQMFAKWEKEPAYRIWEIMQQSTVRPDNIVGVGGAADGLIPDVARLMDCNPIVPEHAEVANALGAAAAQPTVTATLRIDTEQGRYTVLEDGSSGAVLKGRGFSEEDALTLARNCLFERAESLNIKEYVKKTEVVHSEMFNLVRGWSTTGRIYDIGIQNPQEILFYLGQGDSGNE